MHGRIKIAKEKNEHYVDQDIDDMPWTQEVDNVLKPGEFVFA
jgi:hypothetical protein